MADSDTNLTYGTSILTSKSPLEAAAILPHSLDKTSELVESKLLPWFVAYSNHVQKTNQSLHQLLQQGSSFFANDAAEFGNVPKLWNCLLSSIQLEIHTNETFYKNLKLESVGPLKDLAQNDVRYSELVVNSQELNELASQLASRNSNAEYQWNVKAPQIFDNFENFKRHEKQLYFDVILNYFQGHHLVFSKNLSNTENSTNYLLTNYKVDIELKQYLDHVLAAQLSTAPKTPRVPSGSAATHLSLPRIPSVSDTHSLASANTQTSTKSKRQSRLKSKVGSIFGRRNKKASKSHLANDAIPETALSASSTRASSTRSPINQSTDSFSRSNSLSARRSSDIYGNTLAQQRAPQPPAPKQRHSVAAPAAAPVTAPTQHRHLIQAPLQPKVASPPLPQTPKVNPSLGQTVEELPNVVRYDDESSDDDEPVDARGNRLSMLQKHDLAPEGTQLSPVDPPPEFLGSERSRQSSAGKYSFEAGDDTKPISATPRLEHPSEFEPANETLPEPDLGDSPVKLNGLGAYGLATATTAAAAGTATLVATQPKETVEQGPPTPAKDNAPHKPPSPPPSRKVAHTEKRSRSDINSQLFHNLPNTRESFVQPAGTRESFVQPAGARETNYRELFVQPDTLQLVSQNTGNSLLRQNDYFKHNLDGERSGLNSSIAEIVNVTFKAGEVAKAQVIGEVAFHYQGSGSEHPIEFSVPSKIDKFVVNNQFITQGAGQTFTLDPSAVLSRTLGGLKYVAALSESQVPIAIRQIWKFEPHQASLIVIVRLNPQFADKIVLKNLVVSAALKGDVTSTSASSKPEGSFNKDKNRITWRYTRDLVLANSGPSSDGSEPSNQEKLMARIMTNGLGLEHESGVQIKFNVTDLASSYASIVDANNADIPSLRNLVSGSYNSLS